MPARRKQSIRWSLDRACVEFSVSGPTLARALNTAHALPGSDNCYSTGQLLSALYGDLHSEKIRIARETGDKIALENQITRGELLDAAALTKAFAEIADAITTRIMSVTGLPREVREDLLRELSSIPVVMSDVASRTTKFPRSKGQVAEEDWNED